MNIILNGQSLQYPLTGIGYYTHSLLRGLLKHNDINQLISFPERSETNKQIFKYQLNLKKIIQSFPGTYTALNSFRNIKFRQKTHFLTDQNFIYHEPCYILRPYSGPKICTIHDLSHIRYSYYHPNQRVKFLLHNLPASIYEANHIITGSEFIRNEIINLFKISPIKITCVYHGVSIYYWIKHKD